MQYNLIIKNLGKDQPYIYIRTISGIELTDKDINWWL